MRGQGDLEGVEMTECARAAYGRHPWAGPRNGVWLQRNATPFSRDLIWATELKGVQSILSHECATNMGR